MPADAIRPMRDDDLPLCAGMTAAVGWPHRAEDWRFAFDLGFGFMAQAAAGPLGTAMGWRFGAGDAALGMIIIAPSAQGRGLGRLLTGRVMEALEGRRIHLHATKAGLPLYEKLGFRATGLVRQFHGVVAPGAMMPVPGLRAATTADLDLLAAMDGPVDRRAALAALLTVGSVVVLEGAGYAGLRRFGRGQLIGPVVARDGATAQQLIGHLAAEQAGGFLRVDIDDAAGLGPWLAGMGLADAGPAVPMLRGTPVEPGPMHRFALINQALG